jgi:hypothetical protein
MFFKKGFISIPIIILILVLAGGTGYVAVKKGGLSGIGLSGGGSDSLAYASVIEDKTHAIVNGKDMGEIEQFASDAIRLSSGHVAFLRPTADYKTRVIYDGKDIGEAMKVAISGSNIATLVEKDGVVEAFLNNKKVDLGEKLDGRSIVLSGEKLAVTTLKDEIIYDEKNMGVGSDPRVSGSHIVFEGRDDKYISHIIYDGKDMGHGTAPSISGDHLAYVKSENPQPFAYTLNTIEGDIILDGKVVGRGNLPVVNGNHILYVKMKDVEKAKAAVKKDGIFALMSQEMQLVADGKVIEEAQTLFGYDISKDGSVAYTKIENPGEKDIKNMKTGVYVDGKKIGDGFNPVFARD